MWEQNPWLRALLVLVGIAAFLYLAGILWELGNRFGDVILIFGLAWLLAFSLRPLAKGLSRSAGLSPATAVGVVYAGLLILLAAVGLLLLPLAVQQLLQLGNSLPTYLEPLPPWLDDLQARADSLGLRLRLADLYQTQNLVQRAELWGTALASHALTIAQGVATALINLILILVLSFYMMLDADRLTRRALSLLPRRFRDEAEFFMASVDRTFGGFIRGLAIEAILYGIGTALVMLVVGVGFVLPVSAFAGAMMFIPFFGGVLALIPPLLIALLTGDLVKIVVVLVALVVLQQVVINVIGPKVMEHSVGLHPILVLLALLIGIKVAGLWGAFFGVPVAAVLYSMGMYLYQRATSEEPETVASGSHTQP